MFARRKLISCLLSTAAILSISASASLAESINWRNNLDAAKIEANQTGRLLLLHFWTKSCGPCKVLESDVFSQPHLGPAIEKDYVPVKIDADLSPALASAYQIERVPTDVLLTPQGTVLAKLGCPNNANGYADQLARAAQHFRQISPSHNTPQQAPVQSAYAGLQVGQPAQAPPATQPQNPIAQVQQAAPAVTNNPYAAQPQATAQPQVATTAPAPAPTMAPTPNNNSAYNRYAANVPARPAASTTTPPVMQTAQVTNTPPAVNTPAAPAIQTTSAQNAQPAQVNIAVPQAATTPQQAVTPSAPNIASQLPEGMPPLAFDGCCPVTLKKDHKWATGNLKFGAYHRGQTFLFTSEEHQKQFLANPDAYSPVFSGLDVVKMLDEKQEVSGSRKFGFKYLNAFYLFSTQETMEKFAANPDKYAVGVRQAMLRMDPNLGGTIRR